MKIRLVGAELFHADGWTDGRMDRRNEANCRFQQFFRTRLKTTILPAITRSEKYTLNASEGRMLRSIYRILCFSSRAS
jgi:hypothetical protein